MIKRSITLRQLWLKVAKITQERVTPFENRILGWGWLRWFRRHNPNLFLRVAQGFKVGYAKGLSQTLKEAPTRSMWLVSRRFQGIWWVKMGALGLKVRTQIIRYGLPKCPSISCLVCGYTQSVIPHVIFQYYIIKQIGVFCDSITLFYIMWFSLIFLLHIIILFANFQY